MQTLFNTFKPYLFRGLKKTVSFESYFRIQQLFGFPQIHQRFLEKMGYKLTLKAADTFNMRIIRYMLFNRDPRLPIVTDKLRVRAFVSGKIGSDALIPLIDVVKTTSDLNFESYPNSFILKTNFMSGGNIFVRHKNTLDKVETIQKLNSWMNSIYGYEKLNWPAQHIPRRILVEAMLETKDGLIPADYKVYCTNGEPQVIQVDLDRHTNHKQFIYSLDWELLPIGNHLDTLELDAKSVEKPTRLSDLIEMARKLSEGFLFMRVDFYSIESNIYFGEMTPFPGSGTQAFVPYSYEKEYANLVPVL